MLPRNHLNLAAGLAAAVLVTAAAVLAPSRDALVAPLIVFGLLNAAAAVRGTGWIRTIAIAAVVLALLADTTTRFVTAVVLWLVWPPAFFAAWAIGRREGAAVEASAAHFRARATTAAIIGGVAVASIAFRLISAQRLEQTAALFIGIPTLLAVVVVLFTSPRTAIGVACKAVTVGLLVSLIFLGEGLLCVAMSAPLFFAVAIFTALLVERLRLRRAGPARTTLHCVALFALLPMSLEGVHDRLSFARDETVSVTRIVAAPAGDVRRALMDVPRFDRPLPSFLEAGFPRPVSTELDRSAGRARWIVHLRGGETRLNGQEPAPGRLVLDLIADAPGRLAWRARFDDSHMTHFLGWRESVIEWTPVGARHTRVTWTLRYRRGLDPAWYFGPWQRYAARLAAGYLIEAVATP